MILKIKKETILRALLAASKALPSKTPLEALYQIKFEATEAGLTVTCSNADLIIKHFTAASTEALIIEKPGVALLPGKQLVELMKRFKEGWISFSFVEGAVLVKGGNSKFTLKSGDVNTYPQLLDDTKEPLQRLTVSQSQFVQSLKETIPFTSNLENRPALTAVSFRVTSTGWICTSTDSFRLSRVHVQTDTLASAQEVHVLIPKNSLLEVTKLFASTKEERMLELEFYSNQLLFKTPELIVCSRLIGETYPDTDAFIPKQFNQSILMNRAELLEVIDRLLLLVDNQDNVFLETKDSSTLRLRTSQEVGEAEETLSCRGLSQNIQCCFNGHFLKEALQTLSGTDVQLDFVESLRPFLLHEPENVESIRLIVPKRMA